MPNYDDQITKVAKATSPSQTIVAKATSPTQTIVAKGTSPTQTIVPKPYSININTEDYQSILTEGGTEITMEG